MGSAASVSQEEVNKFPQYTILGGDKKFKELQNEEGKVELSSIADPYLKYGGAYLGDPKDTSDFKYLTFTERPLLGPEHKSLMAKFLTPELFEKLKDIKSSKNYTLSNAIQTGVVTPHLGVGCTSGDEECWELFKELYYPIIKGWHGYDAYTQKHPVDLDASKLVFTDAQKEKFNKYVDSTRIRAARNISGFSLPSGATQPERAGVEAVLKQAFAGLGGELKGTYYELGSLSEEQTKFLLDRGFLFQIPTARNLLTGAGAARSWPDNRGIFHNDTQTALAWVNEEDHCRIISMELGGNIPSVFARFADLSNALKASAESNGTQLMWNETLGFLGTCPSNLGTGLRASVMVCLPEFNKLLEGTNHADKELLETVCSAFDLQPRGSAGEHSAAVGAKFDVSNKQRLGFSEVQLVQKMIDGVSRVIELEELLASGKTPDDIRAIINEKSAVKTIFIGPPGSGKGTQATKIHEEFTLNHLSTGDMLRDAVKAGTKLGLEAKVLMDEGKLVGDELVASIVASAVSGPKSASGFILDGFPRTVEQAKILDSLLGKNGIDCVINLKVEDELLIKRITGRLVHPASGRPYNIYFNPPKVEGIDDVTGEPLVKRGDDTEDKLRTRLVEFHEKTAPVLDYYRSKVIDVQADVDMQEITNNIRLELTKIKQTKLQSSI